MRQHAGVPRGLPLYQKGRYTVLKAAKGYEVYRDRVTHVERCAIIGSDGEQWWERAKAEVDRRADQDTATN